MSISSLASLGALRVQSQQRSDLENSPNISTSEWNQYISLSAKRLYDKLVGAYGNDYHVATPFQFAINSTQLYPLPEDFYKLLGVDLQYSATPTGWVTLKRLNFIDRNKWSWLNPAPISSSQARLWYIPKPTDLQFIPICTTSSGSPIVTMADTSDLVAGMNASGNQVPDNTTILSVDTPTQITLSNPVNLTQAQVPLFFWDDAVTFNGIAGWEEYVIIDAAIKANIKQEQPIQELAAMRDSISAEIEAMAEGRDAGQAYHVSDALSVNTSIIATGASNLRYYVLGDNIMFVPSSYDDETGFGAGGGSGFSGW